MKTMVKIGKVLLAVASILVPMALLVAGFWLPINLVCKAVLVLGLLGVLDLGIIFFEMVDGKLENSKSFADALCKQYFWGMTIALVALSVMSGYILYSTGSLNMTLAEIAFALWLMPMIAAGLHSPLAENTLEAKMRFCGAVMFFGIEMFLCIHLFDIKLMDIRHIATAFMQIGFAGCIVCGVLAIFAWVRRKIALG